MRREYLYKLDVCSSSIRRRQIPGWNMSNAALIPIISDEGLVMNEFKEKTFKKGISRGVHTWDFEFSLPGDTAESVVGLGDGFFIKYELQAVLDRGLIYKDVRTKKPLRIIRTLSVESTLLYDSYVRLHKCKRTPNNC